METLQTKNIPGDITVELMGKKLVFRQCDISLDTGEEIGTYFEVTLALLEDIKYDLNITEQMRIIQRKNRPKPIKVGCTCRGKQGVICRFCCEHPGKRFL